MWPQQDSAFCQGIWEPLAFIKIQDKLKDKFLIYKVTGKYAVKNYLYY